MPRFICVLLFFALVPAAALSQAGIAFEFSFSNPGARSMGFGGAFVALADDATAAFANPAGLVQLAASEVSLEVRHWSYSTPFTQSGRLTGQPTGGRSRYRARSSTIQLRQRSHRTLVSVLCLP